MEKQSEHFDDFTRRVVREGGMQSPSPQFFENVMHAIEGDKKVSKAYKPLINGKGWVFVVLAIAACFTLLYFNPIEGGSWLQSKGIDVSQYFSLSDTLGSIEVSKTLVYCIEVRALSNFQIPTSHQYLVKRYE